MIYMDEDDLKIVRDIAQRFPYKMSVYGSRAKGTAKKFSDLDVCVMEPITDLELYYLKEAFEDSDLPFKVDVCAWNRIGDAFKKDIQNDLVPIAENHNEH
jgi:uncharacterized protein